MTAETAADLEAELVEAWVHNWCDPGEAMTWRRFLAGRLADERAIAADRRARGDRSDVWGEVRRLTDWCGVIDFDLISRLARERRAVTASRRDDT